MNTFFAFVFIIGAAWAAPHSYYGDKISPPLTKPFCTEQNLTDHCILADCKILFQTIVTTELKNITKEVCTTKNVHQCIDRSIESCLYEPLMVPVSTTIETCRTNELKSCKTAWACLDDDKKDNPRKKITINGVDDNCDKDEFQDLNDCAVLPTTVCQDEEIEIMIEERKKVCIDTPYEDCKASVPVETCTDPMDALEQIVETHTEQVPYRVCTPVLFPVVPIYPVLPFWKK